ncbi:MAG: hypothetical protein K1000chlam2_00040 [Chlamydiae bacterium]|nr:hypothetical protein [Chlamydiota bacterium]
MTQCSKCLKMKEDNEFYAFTDGNKKACKICHRRYAKSWKERHMERVAQAKRQHALKY